MMDGLRQGQRAGQESRGSALGVGALVLSSFVALAGSDASAQTAGDLEKTAPVATQPDQGESPELVPATGDDRGLKLVSGEVLNGNVLSFDDKGVVVKVDGERRQIGYEEILLAQVSALPIEAIVPKGHVYLIEGSLYGSGIEYSGTEVQLSPLEDQGEGVVFSRSQVREYVRAIQVGTLSDEARGAFEKIIDSPSKTRDTLVLHYPKTGQLKSIECDVISFTSGGVKVLLDDQEMAVERVREDREFTGVVFRRRNNERLPRTAAEEAGGFVVKTMIGEEFHALALHTDQENLRIHLTEGEDGVVLSKPLAAVFSIDLSRDKVFSVDRLSIANIALPSPELMASEQIFRPRFNTALNGKALQLGEDKYSSGMSIQSGSSVEFRLPEGASSFSATVGIDPQVRAGGDLELVILGDRKELLREHITLGMDPVKIVASLNGVRRLQIEVDPGKNLYFGDWLNIANAKVVK
jgi:hypothetical protein